MILEYVQANSLSTGKTRTTITGPSASPQCILVAVCVAVSRAVKLPLKGIHFFK